VLVLVAAAMFPIVAMMTYTIDVSHWFDYSRNLQNRADAAALAGATSYGNICFQSSFGDPWTGQQSVVGKWGQLYSGPANSPSVVPFDGGTNSAANVPYSDASVFAATGASAYTNETNLKLGSLKDYYVRLNADNYADKGGTDFAMGDFCNSDPSKDATDKNPGPAGAMVDVEVTQEQLPNFIPLFNLHPNIEAHARVELQGDQSSSNVRPIAVSDASDTPCVTANFLDNDGNVITSEKLHQQVDAKGNPTGIWDGSANAAAVTMPSNGDPVTVQLFLNNCVSGNPSGLKYDYYDANGKDQALGLVYINNWGSPASPVTKAQIGSGGVTLTGSIGTQCDPYFETETSGTCTIGVDAHVSFPAPAAGVTYSVRAVDQATNNTLSLTPNGANTDWTGTGLSIASDSGPHPIEIQWAQLGGSFGGKTCKTTGNPFAPANSCQASLCVQQRAFAGVDGTNLCGQPSFDTGPMQWITVGTTDSPPTLSGSNAYGANSSPHLFVTTSIVGLSNSQASDPDICLRVGEASSHDTGLIICPPQSSGGTTNDIQSITQGCDPLQIDTRLQADGSLTCNPTIVPNDCVTNDTGQSPPILKGFDQLVGQGSAPACTSAPNKWPTVDISDPRALIMVITAPVDFTTQNGTTQSPTIPIRNFAVFYVTGWSTGQGGVKGCSNNDPAPAGAGNGEIWGHWTSIAVPLGIGTGQLCNFNQFGNCVGVLTR